MNAPPRLLDVVARYGLVIAVACALGGVVLLGGAAQTYTSPPVDTITEQTAQRQFAAEVQTSAVVNDNSTLYEEGRRLRNMPVYFFAGTPNLTLHVKTTVPADSAVRVTQRLVLVTRGSRNGRVFWESQRVLVADATTTETGATWSNTTVNVTRIAAEIRENQAAVGAVGTFQAIVRLNVTYRSPEFAGRLTARSSVVVTDRAYWLQSSLNDSRTRTTTVTRRVVRQPDVQRVGLLAGLGVLALVASVGVFRSYRSLDREAVATERSRRQYDEWISNGEIPTKSEKEYVRTDSLEDLVDVAIDTNKRVIYDRELDAYGVVESDLVYYYTTGDEEFTDWLDI